MVTQLHGCEGDLTQPVRRFLNAQCGELCLAFTFGERLVFAILLLGPLKACRVRNDKLRVPTLWSCQVSDRVCPIREVHHSLG